MNCWTLNSAMIYDSIQLWVYKSGKSSCSKLYIWWTSWPFYM